MWSVRDIILTNVIQNKGLLRMYLYGAGGPARVIRDIVELSGGIVEGFIDDKIDILEKDGLSVIPLWMWFDTGYWRQSDQV